MEQVFNATKKHIRSGSRNLLLLLLLCHIFGGHQKWAVRSAQAIPLQPLPSGETGPLSGDAAGFSIRHVRGDRQGIFRLLLFGAPVPAGSKPDKELWRRLSAHLERRVYVDQCKRHRGPAPQPGRGPAGLSPGGHRPAAAQPPGERGHGGRRCPPAGPASVLRQHEPRHAHPP